jgi:hypothetical protein
LEFNTPDLKVLTTYSQSSAVLGGNDVLKGIKAVVVMAHVFNEGKGTLTFAYPPIDLEGDFDFDQILRSGKNYFILKVIIAIVVIVYLIIVSFIWITKKHSQQSLEHEVREHGIHMQNLPSESNSSRMSHKNVSMSTA